MPHEPRFYVSVVHGWLNQRERLPGLSAHVLDRVYNCACVATFRSEGRRGRYVPGDGRRKLGSEITIEMAERRAAELNRWDATQGYDR